MCDKHKKIYTISRFLHLKQICLTTGYNCIPLQIPKIHIIDVKSVWYSWSATVVNMVHACEYICLSSSDNVCVIFYLAAAAEYQAKRICWSFCVARWKFHRNVWWAYKCQHQPRNKTCLGRYLCLAGLSVLLGTFDCVTTTLTITLQWLSVHMQVAVDCDQCYLCCVVRILKIWDWLINKEIVKINKAFCAMVLDKSFWASLCVQKNTSKRTRKCYFHFLFAASWNNP